MFKRSRLVAVAGISALGLLVGCTSAPAGTPTASAPTSASPEAWKPSGPVTMVIPYGAGGSTDTIGRLLADHMQKTLGVPVVVENVAGSNGTVGTQQVFNATPDGQTILLASGSIQTIIPQTTEIGFDPFEMVYIASTHESVAARFVADKSPYKTIEEVVAAGKEPGKTLVDITSGGFGVPDIGTAMLSKAVGGLSYRSLPTDGGAEAILRLIAGDGDMGQNSATTTIGYIESGEVRPLLIESKSWPLLEDKGIPTSEDKYGYYVVNPASVMAPPGTSEEARSVLEAAVKAALEDTTVFEQMSKTNELIRFMSGADAKAYAQEGFNLYTPIIADLGVAK